MGLTRRAAIFMRLCVLALGHLVGGATSGLTHAAILGWCVAKASFHGCVWSGRFLSIGLPSHATDVVYHSHTIHAACVRSHVVMTPSAMRATCGLVWFATSSLSLRLRPVGLASSHESSSAAYIHECLLGSHVGLMPTAMLATWGRNLVFCSAFISWFRSPGNF
mmetsp:Transcript_44334/g.101631  ORF Transcript_44334/g.101631 Transcript_44334/m.101631 type:complete len:164 (-) Transcript_44334:484-975(-)